MFECAQTNRPTWTADSNLCWCMSKMVVLFCEVTEVQRFVGPASQGAQSDTFGQHVPKAGPVRNLTFVQGTELCLLPLSWLLLFGAATPARLLLKRARGCCKSASYVVEGIQRVRWRNLSCGKLNWSSQRKSSIQFYQAQQKTVGILKGGRQQSCYSKHEWVQTAMKKKLQWFLTPTWNLPIKYRHANADILFFVDLSKRGNIWWESCFWPIFLFKIFHHGVRWRVSLICGYFCGCFGLSHLSSTKARMLAAVALSGGKIILPCLLSPID